MRYQREIAQKLDEAIRIVGHAETFAKGDAVLIARRIQKLRFKLDDIRNEVEAL